MKITVTKGPNFEEAEKRVYQYLHKIFMEKVIEDQKIKKDEIK
jgi:hypothetical protein